MENGHDDEPVADAGPHATAQQLALDQLMTAAEDVSSWTTLARCILGVIAEALSPAVADDESRELIDALVDTLDWQRERLLDALVVARRARCPEADAAAAGS